MTSTSTQNGVGKLSIKETCACPDWHQTWVVHVYSGGCDHEGERGRLLEQAGGHV